MGFREEDDVGVLPGFGGVAEKKNRGVENSQERDKEWGSFFEEEVGDSIGTGSSVFQGPTLAVDFNVCDRSGEFVVWDLVGDGVCWGEECLVVCHKCVDVLEVVVVEVGVHWDGVDVRQVISESLGHALAISDNRVADQEWGGGCGGVVVVFDETPKATGVVVEVRVRLLAYPHRPGLLERTHGRFDAFNEGPIGFMQVRRRRVPEKESPDTTLGLDERKRVRRESEGSVEDSFDRDGKCFCRKDGRGDCVVKVFDLFRCAGGRLVSKWIQSGV